MTIQPQDYEITLLEKHNALHKLNSHGETFIAMSEFQPKLKFCRFTRQTEQKQKREKQRKRKMWQEKVERNCKGLCKDGGEAKRFRAGQERRCGKWIRINISSSIAWLLRKNIPIIQSRPAVNVSLMHFVDFFLGGLKRSHLVGAFHQTANDFFLLSGDAFFFSLLLFSFQLLHLVSRD